jgi:hypothetical protein
MKGARAKRQAEEAAAKDAPPLTPTPPSAPREGGARPGPVVQASDSKDMVQIPADVFAKLVSDLRTNELLGAAAADAFEAAAGLRPVASPQCKAAKELRSNVADSREEEDKPKKKKGMNFADGPIEEIPDIPEKRASISDIDADQLHDAENIDKHPDKDAPEPKELNLTPKQNKMRTDVEMWVMEAIPELYGVDDSEELDESLQEDDQAATITILIGEKDEAKQEEYADKWLKDTPDAGAKADFMRQLLEQVRAIQALGPKKKKKKKTEDS